MDDALLNTLASLKPARLLVLGDLMLDRTHDGQPGDIRDDTSPRFAEPGSFADQPAGAAYVATSLGQWDNTVVAVGLVGDDDEGRILTHVLESCRIQQHVLTVPERPTTLRERFVVRHDHGPQWLRRIDRESAQPVSARHEAQLCEILTLAIQQCDGVVISDYAKGACSPRTVASVIKSAQRLEVPVVVDPARRTTFDHYTGCMIITPNRSEAETASGMSIRTVEDAIEAGRSLCMRTGAEACVMTLDADGAALTSRGGGSHVIPARPRQTVDATGAGDAFTASLLHAIVSGLDLVEAAQWGNFVAGLQVERLGTATLTLEDARRALRSTPHKGTAGKCLSLIDLEAAVSQRRDSGQRIVLTNGCFDLLHAGHVCYLEEAAAEGDCLIVAVNADRTVTRLKGSTRPIMPQRERARLLAALACVDHVVVFDESTPHEVIRRIQPDVLVKGGDYSIQDVVGRELVEQYGGSVRTLSLTPGISTTQILDQFLPAPVRRFHAG